MFSNFFASVYSEPAIGPILPMSCPLSFSFPRICTSDVVAAIHKTEEKCNTSPDGVPNIVFRKCMDTISLPLTIILQNSIDLGTVPEFWKQAIVKPIFKKGDRSSVDNYRPVSLTCSASKIAEKVVIKFLSDYLESNNLISESQAGFRRGRSTTTQMCETTSKLYFLIKKSQSSWTTTDSGVNGAFKKSTEIAFSVRSSFIS